MSKYGGGGAKCTICTKTVYPAETIQYEKKPYHVDCFKCSECNKKMEGAAKAANYEDVLYCKHCFQKGGFAQKQKNVKWVKKEGTTSSIASKFGGGGNPCTVCSKTVYPAETVSFEKKVYHADCLSCVDCSKKLKVSDCAQFEDKTYCLLCFGRGGYRQKQAKWTPKAGGATSAIASKFGGGGNPCAVCTKTVYSAEAVSFEKKIYHGECLVCSIETCKKKCTPSSVAQFDDKLFCTKCFDSEGYRHKQAQTTKSATSKAADPRFAKFGGGGNKCVRCTKTVYPAETVSFEKNMFHGDCFTCKNCSKKLTPSGAEGKKQTDGGVDVYCKKCWGELGLNRARVTKTEE